ncbi:MAG: ISL3 family transposase [Gammaproteobacteria bacterium]|nr:ISL3 family transposase [Gammaproteobacteria bacterium]
MELTTLLNRCYRFKGFVYGKVQWAKTSPNTIEVEVAPRQGSKPYCSGCGKRRPGYDKLPERSFQFIPFWGFAVFFRYARRRVDCPACGVTAEILPWAEGKHHLTTAYMQFLATWARKLSWLEVSRSFHTSWDQVYRSVEWMVRWGLEHRVLGSIKAIGADEIAYSRGHKYLTLVYQIEAGMVRLLWVGKERTVKTFEGFFTMLGQEACAGIEFVCSDMWRPYIRVIRERCSQAVHILDRFHIVAKMNEALDDVRAEEARTLTRNGREPVLKKTRWCLLKRSENLTTPQKGRLKELLRYNLKSVRAYLLKEDFQQLWTYQSAIWAGKFLDTWCTATLRSRIEPMKKIARMCRRHRELILNWFKAKGQISNGIVEGLNNKAKLTIRKSYGFRSPEILEMALYHALGKLPEPKLTHEFY